MDGLISFPRSAKLSLIFPKVADFDRFAPALVAAFEPIIVEDNRKGVMGETQCDDSPTPRVTYRGAGVVGKARARSVKGGFGATTGRYKGPAMVVGKTKFKGSKRKGNLKASQYRNLTGPALAPRGDESRVIANLFTESGKDGDTWVAVGRWLNVVSTKGVPFLPFHFAGKGRLPKRNLAGVRGWGMAKARTLASKMLRDHIARSVRGG